MKFKIEIFVQDKLKEHKGRIHNREPTPPPERKHRLSKLSSLNKYHNPSVQSDISEVVDEDDPGHANDINAPHNNLVGCADDVNTVGGASSNPVGSGPGTAPTTGGFDSTAGCSGPTSVDSGPSAVGSGTGVNKYYSVESGVHLTESQIPYVKEEYILGM